MYEDILSGIEEDINSNWDELIRENHKKELNSFFNEVNEVLDKITELNIKNRKYKGFFIPLLDLYSYLEEYCTIKFDIGRQTGKTEWIKNRIKEEDVIVVIQNKYKKDLISKGINKNNIITSYSIRDGGCRGRTFKNIYVDQASYILNNIITTQMLYRELGNKNIEQTFFLLG